MRASSAGASCAARRRGFSSQRHHDRQRDRGRLGGGKGHHLHLSLLALVGACYILKCGGFSSVPLGQLGLGRQLASVAGSKFCRAPGPGPAAPNPWRLRSGQEGARTRTSRASSSTDTDMGADTDVAADYYEELKVDKGADIKAIKAAFRRLSKKLHPDVASDADCDKTKARFLRVVNAYNTLSDPIKRAKLAPPPLPLLTPVPSFSREFSTQRERILLDLSIHSFSLLCILFMILATCRVTASSPCIPRWEAQPTLTRATHPWNLPWASFR